MRTLTAGATTQSTKQNGAQPSLILRVDWPSGTIYYGETPMTLSGSIQIKPSLIKVTSLTVQQKEAKNQAEYNASSLASCSVILDDIDGSLKTILDTTIIEHTTASLYQYFFPLGTTDFITLVHGKIMSPIVWSEKDRTLQFDVVSKLEDLNIPYASDGTDIPLIFPDSIGKAIPMCFGNPINVPALKLKGSPKGTLRDPLTSETVVNSVITINNGHLFPQGTSIDITVGNAVFTGTFSGDLFTVTVVNKPKYTNVLFTSRVVTDVDNNNPKVGWLVNGNINLVGYQCWTGVQPSGSSMKVPQLNYCWKQVGNKCYFINNWVATNGNNILVSSLHNDQIDEVAVLMRSAWGTSTIIWEYGFNWIYKTNFISWWYSAGSQVRMSGNPPGTGIPDVYYCNQFNSTSVVDVMAFKKVDGQTEDMLLSIPTAYYAVNLNDTLAVVDNGVAKTLHPTTITFAKPLSDIDSGWKDDQIFVSLKSVVGNNTAVQIKYLIDNFTGLTSDASSFSTVQGYLTNYPSNFAILQPENVLKVIEEVAWQARCGIRVDGDIVSIVYLSKKPASLLTVTDALVQLKSLTLSTTEIEQVFTYIQAVWRDSYMSDDLIRRRRIQTDPSYKTQLHLNEDFVLVYQNNITRYGMRKLQYKFYIYNIGSLVQKSLNFWGHRLSNVFREARITNFLTTINLEIFDAVTFGLTDSTLVGGIIGIIAEQSLNPDNWSIGMKISLASLAGTKIEDPLYWLSDASDVLPVDPISLVTPTVFTSYIVTNFATVPMLNNTTNSKQGDIIALGIVTSANGGTDYTVDIYDDGYGNPATVTGQDATMVGTQTAVAGDNVLIHFNSLGAFIHAGAGSLPHTVAVAWNQNLTLTGGLPTIDGYAVQENDYVGVFGQSGAETADATNGIYIAHNSSAWTKVGQPDVVAVNNGDIFGGFSFYLTATNLYKLKIKGTLQAQLATTTTVTASGAQTIEGTSTGALVTPKRVFLFGAGQTKKGLYVVQSSTWVFMGLPEMVVVTNGVYKDQLIYLTDISASSYTVKARNSATVNLASTASVSSPSTQTGAASLDGGSGSAIYILLKDQGVGNAANGVYFVPSSGNWQFMGQPETVYVENGNTLKGRWYTRTASGTYTATQGAIYG